MLLHQVATDVNATTLIELIGIKIAAKSGDMCPVTAKPSPTILYIKLIAKVIFTIVIASLQNFKYFSKSTNLTPAMITSDDGVKEFVSSATAMPTLLCFKAPASFKPSPNMATLCW